VTALRRVLLLAVALAATGPLALAARRETPQPSGFPHEKHARLFPTCTGCHAGIATGVAADVHPAATACAQCHDGVQYPKVPWTSSRVAPSNLRFDHRVHTAKTANQPLECRSCHGATGGVFMAANRAEAAPCVSCHEPKAPSHFDASASQCVTCHVPLTQAKSLPSIRIAKFGKPGTHRSADFATSHGQTAAKGDASCATCHTRESCTRCHVNGTSVASIAALGTDPRVATLVSTTPASYPVPESHREHGFDVAHGPAAESGIATCANCHARSSCESCHIGPLGRQTIAKLPVPPKGAAQGVKLVRAPTWGAATPLRERFTIAAFHPDTEPATEAVGGKGVRAVRPHPPGWVTHHGTDAASAEQSCAGCHTQQRFCSDCHDGEGRRKFHPSNFAQRHPSDAYGREKDCALCHQPEIFCRSCHVQVGLASEGQLRTGYHTGQPVWLLNHGRAARQSLQSCTTCHTQRDCMQCHSSFGWKVNPHGNRFNAASVAARNRLMCLQCHTSDPLGGR
jgi:hypothetical protein